MTGAGRVLGWDVLRGLCALTVAFYHLSYWLDLVELPALGTYGVYLFFALSGASLAYNYRWEQLGSVRGTLAFLAVRWLRLAPLYVLVCLVSAAMFAARTGAPVNQLGLRLALNASFTFGWHDPVLWALAIGGWSLGIEFLFYLLFPAIARVLAGRPLLRWGVLVAAVGLQATWIWLTLGVQGWVDGNVAYHHAPAFIAWFFGGCLVGAARREAAASSAGVEAHWGWSGAALLLAGLVAASTQEAGDELLGWDAVALFAGCLALVRTWGHVRLQGRTARIAGHLGDATYGLYLLHPVMFFAFAWFGAPALGLPEPQHWEGELERLGLLAAVVVTAGLLALASERWLEQPVRRWARRRLRRSAQSEVASISS